MARIQITGIATNTDGADDKLLIIPNGAVTVFEAGTSNPISLYATEGAGSPSAITTDSEGVFNFWIDITHLNKRIKIVVTKGGYSTVTVDNYQVWMNVNALTEKTVLVDNDIFYVEDSEDLYNPKKVKRSNIHAGDYEYFMPPLRGNNKGDYATNALADAASTYISFFAPPGASALSAIKFVFIPATTNAGRDIDFFSDYAAVGELLNNHSESDVASTYDLVQAVIKEIDVIGIFSAIAAGDYCGLKITNNSGMVLDIIGIEFEYSI